MAGDWIKMRGNLWDDPRIGRICDLTGLTEAAAIGGLYWLWATADQHTEDGYMPGMSLKQIDRKTGIKGLGAALVDIGWLHEDHQGVLIQHFDEHNGASAKKRCQTAKRVSAFKSGNGEVTPESETGNAASVTKALAERYLEKEKEKDLKPSPPPAAQSAPPSPKSPRAVKRCPEDWFPPQELFDAMSLEAPAVNIDRELLRFRDHTFKTAHSDWPAAFRNWIRGSQDRAPPPGRMSVYELKAADAAKWVKGTSLDRSQPFDFGDFDVPALKICP
jgi:hypothetical protein